MVADRRYYYEVIILSVVLANICSAAPTAAAAGVLAENGRPYLIKHEHVTDKRGQFFLAYAVSDGTTQMKEGSLVPNGQGTGFVLNQKGTYSFVTPEGVVVKMVYTADKDGFKVEAF